jgi:hypothetical protein
MQTAITILYILFLILALGDIITTIKFLDSGKGYEKNKFLVWLMGKVGIVPALASTSLVAAVLLGCLTYFYPGNFTGVLLILANIYTGYLVWNNLQIIK